MRLLSVGHSGLCDCAGPTNGEAQRKRELRHDASTKKPPIATLSRDSTVTVLNLTPQNGFLHVRTPANHEGWVAAKYNLWSSVRRSRPSETTRCRGDLSQTGAMLD